MNAGQMADVLIIGAGAAGLAAARTLSLEGATVLILEARERIGGRILSLRAAAAPLPVELGAEFIYGRPHGLMEVVNADGLQIFELSQDHWLAQHGELRLDGVLGQLNAERSMERIFRVREGYDAICDFLLRSSPGVKLQLKSIVTDVRWRPGKVEVVTRTAASERVFRARRLIVTLPLGVFKAKFGSEGAVRFSPPLAEKQLAANGLEMGSVFKITFRFRTPFWQDRLNLGFVHAPGEAVPTWWGTQPLRSALLTGWAEGASATTLLGSGRQHAVEQALVSLSRIMAVGVEALGEKLECWYFHDWQSDPFSRGAYSYVVAEGLSDQKKLATPIADTLFFAGEALNDQGLSGTVDGAIETGVRAADEVLQGMQRRFGRAA